MFDQASVQLLQNYIRKTGTKRKTSWGTEAYVLNGSMLGLLYRDYPYTRDLFSKKFFLFNKLPHFYIRSETIPSSVDLVLYANEIEWRKGEVGEQSLAKAAAAARAGTFQKTKSVAPLNPPLVSPLAPPPAPLAKPIWTSSVKVAVDVLKSWEPIHVLGLDLKGDIRRDGQIGFLQLSNERKDCLMVDLWNQNSPIVFLKDTGIKRLLEDVTIVKVMHDSGRAADLLHHSVRINVLNVWDTFRTFNILRGMKPENIYGAGSANVMRHYNIHFRATDRPSYAHGWFSRPLAADQMEFASESIRHLPGDVYRLMVEDATRMGLFDLCVTDSNEYCDIFRHQDNPIYPGDWNCPQCRTRNFKNREVCHGCDTKKPRGITSSSMIEPVDGNNFSRGKRAGGGGNVGGGGVRQGESLKGTLALVSPDGSSVSHGSAAVVAPRSFAAAHSSYSSAPTIAAPKRPFNPVDYLNATSEQILRLSEEDQFLIVLEMSKTDQAPPAGSRTTRSQSADDEEYAHLIEFAQNESSAMQLQQEKQTKEARDQELRREQDDFVRQENARRQHQQATAQHQQAVAAAGKQAYVANRGEPSWADKDDEPIQQVAAVRPEGGNPHSVTNLKGLELFESVFKGDPAIRQRVIDVLVASGAKTSISEVEKGRLATNLSLKFEDLGRPVKQEITKIVWKMGKSAG